MQSTAAAKHARVSAWLLTRWRSRCHLRKGRNSCTPIRSTSLTRAVFHPQLGKQIAKIMTVHTDAVVAAVLSTVFTQGYLHALHGAACTPVFGQRGASAPCCCLMCQAVAHTGWICSASSINSRTTTAVCNPCFTLLQQLTWTHNNCRVKNVSNPFAVLSYVVLASLAQP